MTFTNFMLAIFLESNCLLPPNIVLYIHDYWFKNFLFPAVLKYLKSIWCIKWQELNISFSGQKKLYWVTEIKNNNCPGETLQLLTKIMNICFL